MYKIILILFALSACAGDNGELGAMGEPGPQGPQGDRGDQGPRGLEGPTGPAGDTGPQGLQGATGLQGPAGDTGSTGPQGATGLQGVPGPQGSAGADGAPGPSLYLFNASGQLGHPMTIDRGTGLEAAIYATRDFPAASFPQGRVVASTPVVGVFYSGFSCTGTAYIRSSESSKRFDALYLLGVTTQLWDTSGSAVSRAVNSFDSGTSCGPTGGTVTAYIATPTSFTINLSSPWNAASF